MGTQRPTPGCTSEGKVAPRKGTDAAPELVHEHFLLACASLPLLARRARCRAPLASRLELAQRLGIDLDGTREVGGDVLGGELARAWKVAGPQSGRDLVVVV